ncbi:ABC transporter substrate-binding protein [Streptomyces acidiscabies]|uniref:Sugar ABC transporter substrate-binding protein n=2 Tax=Streptomyces acidiscabies TaxID=42234 RepID=A0AAP6BCP4_9ACTN|nr:sugar ABC transporter substrate-binding protein [Streptomyces acidiscabies]MDX2962047.1 sugar ABC transporter substrate-binding protein [Streptomyces acidiscabies]MDX3017956.1 sugar ABC transporter substrate-binding protein [Streptomyces acidiscabies]MDX3791271.1 sugar ABC transporter substrate-binding protein [Streptomyces acidiscabies]
MSRRGFLGVSAAAGVVTLTACGGSASGSSSGPLLMTVWGGDTDRKTYQARIDLLVKKYPDLKIKLQLIPNDSYPQKVQTMIAGGSGPDIMQVAESVNTYSSKNQLLPLDDLAKAAKLDTEQRFGPVGSLYSYQDKLYAIPDRSGAVTVFYNKDMFDKKGIKAPTADWTWDDALAAFKELTVPGKVWGYSGAEWWPQWWSLAYQNGGTIIDANGRPAVDSDAVVEALQWAGDLVFKHKVVPSKADYADMGPDIGGDQAFPNQKVATHANGFWVMGGLTAAKFAWDIAPMWRGKKQAVSAFGSGLAISRTSKQRDNAFKAIDFLTSLEAQTEIISSGQDVPANLEVQKSPAFLKPAWMKTQVDMGAFAESSAFVFRAPFIPEWQEMIDTISNGLADFWLGKERSAKKALTAVQKDLEALIKSGS